MGIFESIVLGLVQGLTEFIPVSSSGHLVIAQIFFGGSSDHFFLEWIDLGTFIALVFYFRHRLVTIGHDIFMKKNYRLGRNILLTAVPAGLVGLILTNFIESSPFFGSLVTVTVTLALVGILMIVVDKLPHKSPVKTGEKLSPGRALTIGLFQVFALIPGVSRSGSTIVAGRLMGLDAAAAAEYSFLASLPIIGAVLLKLVFSSAGREYYAQHALTLTLSNLVAFASGLWAVSFLISYLSKHGLAAFGWYRVGLASVLVVYLLIQ
ncbi:MAG: putative Undecaprenyl-diphosphatase [Candidatus Saccharibacteria bacterium]|nr:putative Undecaprenyl-diphosphatase [Candidatus Saccharibacteria bacterium]